MCKRFISTINPFPIIVFTDNIQVMRLVSDKLDPNHRSKGEVSTQARVGTGLILSVQGKGKGRNPETEIQRKSIKEITSPNVLGLYLNCKAWQRKCVTVNDKQEMIMTKKVKQKIERERVWTGSLVVDCPTKRSFLLDPLVIYCSVFQQNELNKNYSNRNVQFLKKCILWTFSKPEQWQILYCGVIRLNPSLYIIQLITPETSYRA